MEALRAAPYWPAVAQGKWRRARTIQPGKVAATIAVRGDVLRYPSPLFDVDLVIARGERYR